jgi:hypothetical protein
MALELLPCFERGNHMTQTKFFSDSMDTDDELYSRLRTELFPAESFDSITLQSAVCPEFTVF